MRTRIRYSQNFLKSSVLVQQLLNLSSITNDDVVLEIGPGQGIITQELIKRCKNIVAYEIDTNLYEKLHNRFQEIELHHEDFILAKLPYKPYKVFSNIPFNITSEIVKKLIFAENPPVDSYLIMQKEAALKFAGKPLAHNNSLMSLLLQTRFQPSIEYSFQKNDFYPMPSVDTVLFRFSLFQKVESMKITSFYDYVTYEYIHGDKKITQKTLDYFIEKFKNHKNPPKVDGSFKKLLNEQESLHKINRTRNDASWKELKH